MTGNEIGNERKWKEIEGIGEQMKGHAIKTEGKRKEKEAEEFGRKTTRNGKKLKGNHRKDRKRNENGKK